MLSVGKTPNPMIPWESGHALKASSCQSALARLVAYLSYTKPERRK